MITQLDQLGSVRHSEPAYAPGDGRLRRGQPSQHQSARSSGPRGQRPTGQRAASLDTSRQADSAAEQRRRPGLPVAFFVAREVPRIFLALHWASANSSRCRSCAVTPSAGVPQPTHSQRLQVVFAGPVPVRTHYSFNDIHRSARRGLP